MPEAQARIEADSLADFWAKVNGLPTRPIGDTCQLVRRAAGDRVFLLCVGKCAIGQTCAGPGLIRVNDHIRADCHCEGEALPGRPASPEEHHELSPDFPALPKDGYTVTHPADRAYNCIGWSLCSRSYGWVWPRREKATIAWFDRLYAYHGWKPARDCKPVRGRRKLALYCKDGVPTHAAKQRRGDQWVSKLGGYVRIVHVGTAALEGGLYGTVCRCYEKSLRAVLDEARQHLADIMRRIAAGENGMLAHAASDAESDIRGLEADIAREGSR
jgi:ribosomal protein L36